MELNSFNQTRILDFLNTAQSGSAQKASGLTVKDFFVSVSTSFTIGLTEIALFSILRLKLKGLYQIKNTTAQPSQSKKLTWKNFVSWVKPTIWDHQLGEYLQGGLDAYFFLRYLTVLTRFFSFVTVFNNLILLPVNYSGRSEGGTVQIFFDSMSMSNIEPERSDRYVAHFVMAVFVILLFHYVLIKELENYSFIRKHFLLSKQDDNIVIIENIPVELQEYLVLYGLFDILPGGVKDLWFVYDVRELRQLIRDYNRIRKSLESLECSYIRNVAKGIKAGDSFRVSHFRAEKERNCKWITLGNIRLRVPIFNKDVDTVKLYCEQLVKLHEKIHLLSEEISIKKKPLHGKVFIQFHRSISAHIVKQIVLFEKYTKMNHQETGINPTDIIWENVIQERNFKFKLKSIFARVLAITITICWVVPVSAIGILSQLPYLTKLVPFLKLLNHFPEFISGAASGILPTISLAALMEIVLWIFSKLSVWKGKVTGFTCQIDLQNWLFMFLFVQLFLIVTISSGITFIFESLINNPVSIPTLLAMDLPKASNFFHSFILMRSSIYLGNTLLQPKALFVSIVLPILKTQTPRERLEQTRYNNKISWGQVYPMFTVFGCIGLVYSIVSPLILIFIDFSFFLVSIGFKYNIYNVYNHRNESETNGQLYPTALLQLYTGVYGLELALLGIFMLQGCRVLAFFMFLGFLVTVVANSYIKSNLFNQSLAFINYSDIETCKQILKPEKTEPKPKTGPLKALRSYEPNYLIPNVPSNLHHISTNQASEKTPENQSSPCLFFPTLPSLSLLLPSDRFDVSLFEARRLQTYGFDVSFGENTHPYNNFNALN